MVLEIPFTVPLLGGSNNLAHNNTDDFYDPISLKNYSIELSKSGIQHLVSQIRQKNFDEWDWFLLSLAAESLAIAKTGSTKLLALDHLSERWKQVGVVPYPHQIKTAEKVINQMQGQAILADEVGLGKTIEAGLILKEFMLRGLARKVLILTPAGLVWQWYTELYEKFDIVAGIQKSEWDWEYADVIIASIDTAKRKQHATITTGIPYDMVIIDEAHKLKNSSTASFKYVNNLQKKYCLMLTATPVQNDLKELYNLISLLKPGQLGSYRTFKTRFIKDKRTPKNPDELRELLAQVMIRNKRGEGTVQFTKRIVHPIVVNLSQTEKELYDAVTKYIRTTGRLSKMQNILPLITLQREVCSSFFAAGITLQKMIEANTGYDNNENKLEELLNRVVQVKQSSKCDVLEKLMQKLDDKVIIFTEYHATQEYIRYRLEHAGYSTLGFDGRLSRGKKEWIKYRFQNDAQVLVSTESGGEGLNFQFCNNIINFDLPWNPMRLEQRIGRLHRLGQTRDVHIYNLVTRGTIEEHIMYLLHKKINMFQSIIGELDAILMHLKLDKTFESEIMKIFIENDQTDRIQAELDQFGEQILQSHKELRSSGWDLL